MKSITLIATSLATLASPSVHGGDTDAIAISHADSRRAAEGPAQYFTGAARVDPLIDAKDPSRVTAASVTFEPGARTAWHSHPLGQHLIVTAGSGWVQQEGGEKLPIKPGDVIWTPPGVKHWHGATPACSLKHIAVQETLDGGNVTWMEKVTDEQYQR